MPRLENWSIISEFNPYQAPEYQVSRIEGKIYDDEMNRFPDGSEVTTSRLVELDLKNNVAQTNNTKYILGEISNEYREWLKLNNMTLEQFVK